MSLRPVGVGSSSFAAQDTIVSLACHMSGFTPTPSLLTTGLSFWDCHINGTTFLITLGSWRQRGEQVHEKTKRHQLWQQSHYCPEIHLGINSCMNILAPLTITVKNEEKHKYSPAEEWASMWYTGWERCCLEPQRPAKKLLAQHCNRFSRVWLWVKEAGPTFCHLSLSNAGRSQKWGSKCWTLQ